MHCRPLLFAFTLTLAPLFPSFCNSPVPAVSGRMVMKLNDGWLFASGDIAGGRNVSLAESAFKPVCLPHTVAAVKHRGVDTSTCAKISWYRRHFSVPREWQGSCFSLEFQAVSKVATVYLNGEQVGEHKGAYTPFTVDITPKIKYGADNVIAVRVDSRRRRDVPPEGIVMDYLVFGGIVRNVTMVVTDRLHIDWAFIRRNAARPACVDVTTSVVNRSDELKKCALVTQVADSAGVVVISDTAGLSVNPGATIELPGKIGPIPGLRTWHPDHPYLYTAVFKIIEHGRTIDTFMQRFGVRTIAFSRSMGEFSINGQPLKLRGLNRHESFPFIGRAAADRLQRRDADILKHDYGCNIVRCSHYPQAPAFLDRCDEIGLLVIEEIPGWLFVGDAAWQSIALRNVKEMVMRDRNHPSVISYGVRINESADFHDFYLRANQTARRLDSSRPTHGVRVTGRGATKEFLEDIWCQNFAIPGNPNPLPWITTEAVGHHAATHSWDDNDRLLRQLLMHAAALDSAAGNPKIAGLLGWCAFDYNSPYYTAENQVNYHGVGDLFRFPKPAARLYRSQADPARYGPMVYIVHDWQKAMTPNDIWVAGNCETVELFVNGISAGRRTPGAFLSLPHPLFVWRSVPFKPGELKAVGYIGGKIAATFTRHTAGAAAALAIAPDDSILETGGDMTRVAVATVDARGCEVPRAGHSISISVSGPGDFFGENPVSLENGKTAFYIQTRSTEPGEIVCTVRCPGLKQAETRIRVRSPSPGR